MALTALWLQGLESALPAAGVASRVYFATDTGRIFVDSGSAWVRNNLVHRGTYAGGTTYYDKDLVSYNGDVWKALATVTGVTPVEGASWTIFVAKGATGSAGSGIASVDGVSNNGGDVDFVAGTNMTITPNDGANTITFAASGGSPPFADNTAIVKDDADATKLVRVDAGTVATGTTRVLTMPNADVNLTADQATGTASLRTLGTGATQAAAGNDSRITGAVQTTRTVSTTAPLTGGGDLSANRTLAVSASSSTAQGVVELATDAETTAGTDTVRATTPANVKAAIDARISSMRDWAFSGTLTTATGTMRVPIHTAGTITSIRAMVNTAPTGAAIIIDCNKNGTTLYTTQGNRPTIAVSTNAVSATLPDVTSLAAGDYLTVDIDQVGSTVAGANLVVSIRYSY